MPVDEHAVWARLDSAAVRAKDLVSLNGGDLGGADADVRQRLAQEFFFHLVGSIEFVAQLAAERRGVGSPDTITAWKIADLLRDDSLEAPLRALYANPRKAPFPADPYNGAGSLWRIYNYRHQVTHRGTNPFHFRVFLTDAALSMASASPAQDPTAHFLLDPLDATKGPSRETVAIDTEKMIDLTRLLLARAINAL